MPSTGFFHANQELLCDGVSVATIAEREGTPLYVYSAAAIRERFRAIDDAFGGYPHAVHYALKANSTLAIARLLKGLGSAADANSVWEIEVARRAGFTPQEIVFTGVGKSTTELECAVPLGLKAINVESAGELARIEAIAQRLGRPARVAVRVNPDIDAKSHPHISTGLKINKFGIAVESARQLFASIGSRPFLKLVAVHVHIGSQITSLAPLRGAARFIAGLTAELQRNGVQLDYVDVGGGLGISYDAGEIVSAGEYVSALVEEVRPTGLPIVVEPGRSIVGPASALVATAIDIKPRNALSEFVVIDAGMTELMRPALYGAFHQIVPVAGGEPSGQLWDVVGPICESSDIFGRGRPLPDVHVGDLLAVLDAGAYGAVMASNYNRRMLPPEVMVDGGCWEIIRRRQTLDDVLALEV